jgi:hypothetical protein
LSSFLAAQNTVFIASTAPADNPFHGDNGAGLGASHQSGWTGVVAKLIELFGRLDGTPLLDAGKAGAFAKKVPVLDKRVA